jgi:hypothetical protein
MVKANERANEHEAVVRGTGICSRDQGAARTLDVDASGLVPAIDWGVGEAA